MATNAELAEHLDKLREQVEDQGKRLDQLENRRYLGCGDGEQLRADLDALNAATVRLDFDPADPDDDRQDDADDDPDDEQHDALIVTEYRSAAGTTP